MYLLHWFPLQHKCELSMRKNPEKQVVKWSLRMLLWKLLADFSVGEGNPCQESNTVDKSLRNDATERGPVHLDLTLQMPIPSHLLCNAI
mmetsp:Transcript_6926/g.14601  ORF Transcript_6926/g.14601 Transcript_6926/m.14601 type:complete len:89 (+) Transcript_6926:345-611(+)